MIARVAARRIHYAWVVVAVTFIVMLSSAGVRAIPGVLIMARPDHNPIPRGNLPVPPNPLHWSAVPSAPRTGR